MSAAKQSAKAGDFMHAAKFLSSVGLEDKLRGWAWKACLDIAQTPEQVVALYADDPFLAIETAYPIDYEIASLRVTGDAQGLIGRAEEEAAAIEGSSPGSNDITEPENRRRQFITAAFDTLRGMDASLLPDLARRVLPHLRAHDARTDFSARLPYTEALIRAGDPDEPLRALEDIRTIPADRSHVQIYAYWELQKMLRKANPALEGR
jgi:hypothetical protein